MTGADAPEPGSQPIRPRWERMAQMMVGNPKMPAVRAYVLSRGDGDKETSYNSAKAIAHKISRDPRFQQRIQWLRARQREAIEVGTEVVEVSAGVLLALMAEISDLLQRAHARAVAENCGESVAIRLRRAIATHAGRQSSAHINLSAVDQRALGDVGEAPTLNAPRLCQCVP